MADTVSTKSTNDDHNQTVLGQDHTSQDINTDEALSASNATFNSMAQMNMKRTYDLHQTLDADAIHNARRLQMSEDSMRLRHAEELHAQKMRHADTEHVVKIQTLQTGSVGNSAIVRDIASDTADRILAFVKDRK